ncbi:MAG: glycoside hydrolase family 2 TIM barrel-domain containing protein, partial [Kiritimatiellae bacterium]|nr:glycoside hydrolase family 2 TIM barrel-domain containing protein [Kiritimatiellia bacterium]
MSDNASRLRFSLDRNWSFQRGRVKRGWLEGQGEGETITVPHCWNAGEELCPGKDYYRGPAAYRVTFDLPDPGRPGSWRLRSGGFYGTGRLHINGRDAGGFNGDYLGFDIDLTGRLRAGANLLACTLTNRCGSSVLPGRDDPDFLLYGGLAGPVWLEHVPELQLDDRHVRVVCRDLAEGCVEAIIQFQLINTGRIPRQARVVWTIRPPRLPNRPEAESIAVETALTLAPGGTTPCALSARLPRAARWSSETPWLYEYELTLHTENGCQDGLSSHFGVRRLECRPGQGLFCDGGRIDLRGCNRHEQMPGFGNAMPLALHRLDAQAIRDAGLNFVRLSHYPQSSAFLDACDQIGVWVMPEIASWKSVRGGGWLRAAEHHLARLVRRDRHHPCVLLWGLGNESRHRRAYIRMDALVKQLDPEQRPTIYAENHFRKARRARTLQLTDVWGLNDELEVLGDVREASRQRCVLVTECANMPQTPRGDREAEVLQRDRVAAEVARCAAGAHGFAIWSFSDYATRRKGRVVSYSGILDGWREPKMAARWLAANSGLRPVLAVWCDWSVPGPSSRRACIITNCKELSRVTVPVWPPPRESGGAAKTGQSSLLQVTSVAANVYETALAFDGQPLRLCGTWQERQVVCCLDPWEAAADLRLSVESVDSEFAGGERIGMVSLQVVDKNAHAVRSYDGYAEVRVVSGQARLALLGGRTLPVRDGTARICVAQASAAPE